MRLLRSVTPRPPRKPFGPGLEADGLVDLADVVRLRVDLRYALAALDRIRSLCSDAEDRRDWLTVASIRSAIEGAP
jgi:hypothetical protein